MKKIFCTTAALMLLSCWPAFAADERSEASAACREETKRVVVWSHGPKAQPAARVETRDATGCDAKVSQPSPRERNKS